VLTLPAQKLSCAMAAESPHDATTAIGSTRRHDRTLRRAPPMVDSFGER
jgi:hypothetical protein